MKAKDIKKAAKKAYAEGEEIVENAVKKVKKAAAPKIKAIKKAAAPKIEKAKKAVRGATKDALVASGKSLVRAGKKI